MALKDYPIRPQNIRGAAQFERQKIDKHTKRSKGRGDYHFIVVQSLTGEADFSPSDHGEAPQGATW